MRHCHSVIGRAGHLLAIWQTSTHADDDPASLALLGLVSNDQKRLGKDVTRLQDVGLIVNTYAEWPSVMTALTEPIIAAVSG